MGGGEARGLVDVHKDYPALAGWAVARVLFPPFSNSY